MRLFSQSTTILLCFAICISVSSSVGAQNQTARGSTSQVKDKQFAEKFWNYLLSNNYKHWSPAPGKTAKQFASQTVAGTGTTSPHGVNVKMYVNRTAASNPDSLPLGSVLILENYRQDKSLETISVMYRTPGFNPSANDWYWANYNPDGSLTAEQGSMIGSIDHNGVRQASGAAPIPRKLVGRTLACIECHKSGGTDLAFFNDKTQIRTAAAPLFEQTSTEGGSSFTPKLQAQPAAVFEQGSQQNFNLEIEQEAVLSNAP